ncbi:hypothetical protein L209DRAFT_544046 [Thermothelomyces heterothallicus CBS 203.75]
MVKEKSPGKAKIGESAPLSVPISASKLHQLSQKAFVFLLSFRFALFTHASLSWAPWHLDTRDRVQLDPARSRTPRDLKQPSDYSMKQAASGYVRII